MDRVKDGRQSDSSFGNLLELLRQLNGRQIDIGKVLVKRKGWDIIVDAFIPSAVEAGILAVYVRVYSTYFTGDKCWFKIRRVGPLLGWFLTIFKRTQMLGGDRNFCRAFLVTSNHNMKMMHILGGDGVRTLMLLIPQIAKLAIQSSPDSSTGCNQIVATALAWKPLYCIDMKTLNFLVDLVCEFCERLHAIGFAGKVGDR